MRILLISFAIAILDQATKSFAQGRLARRADIPLIPGFFDLTYVENTGAAWGMLQGQSLLLVGMSVVMVTILIVCRKHFVDARPITHISTGLIIGGIVGNLIDRVRLGYVIDFLDFYWRDYSFPAFNVADSAICVGVGIYILLQLLQPVKPPGAGEDAGAAPIKGE